MKYRTVTFGWTSVLGVLAVAAAFAPTVAHASVVAAATGNVLPVALSATPIPEMGTVMPIIGLIVAIGSTSFLRRRRIMQMRK